MFLKTQILIRPRNKIGAVVVGYVAFAKNNFRTERLGPSSLRRITNLVEEDFQFTTGGLGTPGEAPVQ